MKLYAGTTEQFRADARMHRIAEKLRAEYTTQIGHRPAPSDVANWQNSLMALALPPGLGRPASRLGAPQCPKR